MPAVLHRFPVDVVFKKNGLGLIESHHEEGFFMEGRRDPFPKILLIIGGEGVLHHADGIAALRAPGVAVIPAGWWHRLEDEPGRPMSLYGICLRKPGFPGGDLIGNACGRWRVETESGRCRRISDLMKELLVEERLDAPGAADLQLAIVCRILVELARAGADDAASIPDSRARVAACIEAMSREFWKARDIAEAAQVAGLSRRRFTQLFREVAGESWQMRLTRIRMEHAAQLLTSTRLPIRSVAFECGYADLSHFYRVFKSWHQRTPAAMRK